MNKTELVAEVSEKAGLTKRDAEAAVKAIVDSVTEALAKGDKVQLVGFGTFEVRASKAPAFKAGQALKDAVNG